MEDDFTEPTYEVSTRVLAEGPIPSEEQIRSAVEALRTEFPEIQVFVRRI